MYIKKKSKVKCSSTWSCLLAVALFFATGCQTTDSNRTRAEGTATGVAIGALAGQLIGGDIESTLIGAAIGSAIGLGVGNHVANKKSAFTTEEDHLNAVISEAEGVADETRKRNEQIEKKIVSLESEVERLLVAIKDAENDKSSLGGDRVRILAEIEILKSQTVTDIKLVSDELIVQQRFNDQISSQGSYTLADTSRLLVAIEDLKKQKAELQQSLKQIEEIDTRVS